MPDNQQRLKSAIIGCGRIGVAGSARLSDHAHPTMLPVSHAECMIASQVLELAAFCDVNMDSARNACEVYQTGKAYTDVVEMLGDQMPDIVSIATRTQERPEIVEILARGGVRGIYAEKPFSRSLAECQSALASVELAKVKIVLGTTRRYTKLYRTALAICTSGRLGKLLQVRIQLAPASQLMWTVPHSIDLLQFFSGGNSIDFVQATCQVGLELITGCIIDCDPVVEAVTMRFNNGVLGTMHVCSHFGVALVCEHGEIHLFEREPMVRIIHAPSSNQANLEDELVYDTMSGTTRAFVELAEAVRYDKASPVKPEEVLLNQALLMGIAFSSIQNGRRIRLDEVPPDLTITGKVGDFFA